MARVLPLDQAWRLVQAVHAGEIDVATAERAIDALCHEDPNVRGRTDAEIDALIEAAARILRPGGAT